MENNLIYLYPIRLDLYTNYIPSDGSTSDTFSSERYRKVYNRNLKIYKGADTRIDIQLRNTDQKPLSYSDTYLVFQLTATEQGELIFRKDLDDVDSARGTARLTLTDADLIDIENGFYRYSFVQERRFYTNDNYRVTSRHAVYFDAQYGAFGNLEIVGDVIGDPDPSLVVDSFSYINPFSVGSATPKYYISSLIDARPYLHTGNKIHTFQFYTTNYTGAVTIEGSIDKDSDPKNWSALKTIDVLDSNITYENIVGKYNWFRVKHIPNAAIKTGSFTVAQTILGNYMVSIREPGTGYKIGDIIVIKGSALGGEEPTNDLSITVTDIGISGDMVSIDWNGVSYNGVRTFVVDASVEGAGTIDKILYR